MSARSYRDAKGRPLVAVTGIGVVSSLGQGPRIAGTVDFLNTDPLVAPLLSERFAAAAAEEAVAQSGIGSKGDFPGALFIAVPPVEMEWPQRQALAEASGQNDGVTYGDLLKAAASGRFKEWHDLFLFGTVAD